MKVASRSETKIQLEDEREYTMQEGEAVVSLSNGMLLLENAATGKTRSIFVHQSFEKRANLSSMEETQVSSPVQEQRVKESEVLQMSIDAA